MKSSVRLPMLFPWDNPANVRARKYATGTHLVMEFVDVRTAASPKDVVWEKDRARLYRYRPTASRRHSVPILIVYGLILRPYVLDLAPGSSLVEYLVDQGFEVYLLDFGVPNGDDGRRGLDEYVLDYIDGAVQEVARGARTSRVSLMGLCMGGTLAAIYASLCPDRVQNLVLLASPIDFAPETPGLLGLWTLLLRSSPLDTERLAGSVGAYPGEMAARILSAGAKLFADLTRMGGSTAGWTSAGASIPAEWLAICKWVDDGVSFPRGAFHQWIRDFYQDNRLVRGQLEIGGCRVDLAEIRCPVLNVAGTLDAVTPQSQTEATVRLVGSGDKEYLVLEAGHLGLVVGPSAKNELWPRLAEWLRGRSAAPTGSSTSVGAPPDQT